MHAPIGYYRGLPEVHAGSFRHMVIPVRRTGLLCRFPVDRNDEEIKVEKSAEGAGYPLYLNISYC